MKTKKRTDTKPVQIRVPSALLKKVDLLAKKEDRTRTYVVLDSLRRRLDRIGIDA